jgi:hypothetical protein
MLEQADETEEPLLEQPDKIIISSPVTSVAEPVLTPLGINRLLNPYQMTLFLVLA